MKDHKAYRARLLHLYEYYYSVKTPAEKEEAESFLLKHCNTMINYLIHRYTLGSDLFLSLGLTRDDLRSILGEHLFMYILPRYDEEKQNFHCAKNLQAWIFNGLRMKIRAIRTENTKMAQREMNCLNNYNLGNSYILGNEGIGNSKEEYLKNVPDNGADVKIQTNILLKDFIKHLQKISSGLTKSQQKVVKYIVRTGDLEILGSIDELVSRFGETGTFFRSFLGRLRKISFNYLGYSSIIS